MSKAKKGYSLVEVVIALSVVVTVSITALTIVLSSISTKRAAIGKTEAQNFAENAWECFKVSESEEEFMSNLTFSEGVSLTNGTEDEDGYTVYSYDSKENKFTAIIKIKYSETARSEFAVDVTNHNGNEVVSFTYQKGDGA